MLQRTRTQIQKKICLVLVLLLVLGLGVLGPSKTAEAADVNVIIHISPEGEISVGDTVTATITVRGELVWDTTVTVSYPTDILECSSGSGGSVSLHIDGESAASVSFKAIANGTARISTSGSGAYDSEGNTLEIEHASDSVTIGKKEEVTEKKTETEKKSEEATEKKTEEASEKTSEEGSEGASEENTEQSTESQVDLKDARAEIDGVTYVFRQPEDPEQIPKDFTLTSIRYLNWMVPAYISKNQVLTIVALTDATKIKPADEAEDGSQEQATEATEDTEKTEDTEETDDAEETGLEEAPFAWYRFNDRDNTLTPFVEYSAELKFVPMDKPSNVEIPEGFSKVTMDLGHGALTVYQDPRLDKIVLIYGVTPTGVEGFYYFDTIEKTFIRYLPVKIEDEQQKATAATTADTGEEVANSQTEDEGIFNKDNLGKMLIGAVALFLLMAIFAMVLLIQNSKLQNRLDELESDRRDEMRKRRARSAKDVERVVANGKSRYKDDEEDEDDEDEEDEDDMARDRRAADGRPVSGETIEIILEEAEDNNRSVNVPPVHDKKRDKVADAMKDRPYGIDSAFDVVDSDADTRVKSNKPQKVALPGDDDLEDE